MLEVAVGVEVEAYQNRDDLRVGHHALPAPFRGVRRGRTGVFCHLYFKFFAKIIRNKENPSASPPPLFRTILNKSFS